MWLNSNDFSNNYKQFLTVQDLMNFRSARGCGCQSSKIHMAGQFSSCSATFLLALFECPHLHNLHWKARFLYFSAFPFFLRRIPNSSTCSTTQKKIINSTQSTSKRYFSGSSSKVGAIAIKSFSIFHYVCEIYTGTIALLIFQLIHVIFLTLSLNTSWLNYFFHFIGRFMTYIWG